MLPDTTEPATGLSIRQWAHTSTAEGMHRLVWDLLANFPDDGCPDRNTNQFQIALSLHFVEEHILTRRCGSCGGQTPGSIYYKLTPAGHFFVATMTAMVEPEQDRL